MDKPTLTPPELRRKKADIDGRLRAKEEESSKFIMEADDAKPIPDEEWKRADGLTAEILDLRKRSELLTRQIIAAERWAVVDDAIADGNGRASDPLPHEDPSNTRGERLGYSMMKAIRSVVWPNRYPLDGLEREVDQEMRKRREGLPRKAEGVQIPLNLPVDAAAAFRYATRMGVGSQRMHEMLRTRAVIAEMRGMPGGSRDIGQEMRALDTTAGAGSIPTILDTTMIEILRARMVTFNLGARVMTDMQGLFAIPRQSAASTFYMVGQGSSVTASNQTIDQVPFSPHTGGVNTQWTRQFLEQTNQDAEMLVREDQAAVVARGVETQGLDGQGSAGYPLGILQNPLIAVYAIGANGGAPTWTQLVSQEAFVAYFNADVGNLAYITDALMRGTLKLTTKIASSTFPIYLWNTEAPDFPINGYPCGITNLLPQNLTKGNASSLHTMIFGNWEDLVYAFWSGMDVIVDPYTSAPQGGVNLITLQDFDVNVRHYQSFANCIDLVSSITAPVT